MPHDLTASLVLYKTDPLMFEAAIASYFGSAPEGRLVVVDNSPTPLSSPWFDDPRVTYIFANTNLGFGAGNNVAIRKLAGHSRLHLLLNPDIRFAPEVLPHLVQRFDEDADLVAIMPRINYPDGGLQQLCKLVPSPLDLIVRRFIPLRSVRQRIDRRYELHDLPQDRMSSVPMISGCFSLLRSDALVAEDGFDERYFMYMEDFDLFRRLGRWGKVRYDPTVNVIHDYAKGSYLNPILARYHIRSAIKFFNRWGWLFDRERQAINREALQRLRIGQG
jgi:GT2 family glycosyltransferase